MIQGCIGRDQGLRAWVRVKTQQWSSRSTRSVSRSFSLQKSCWNDALRTWVLKDLIEMFLWWRHGWMVDPSFLPKRQGSQSSKVRRYKGIRCCRLREGELRSDVWWGIRVGTTLCLIWWLSIKLRDGQDCELRRVLNFSKTEEEIKLKRTRDYLWGTRRGWRGVLKKWQLRRLQQLCSFIWMRKYLK